MQPKDRLQKLLDTATNKRLNGIDFVEIASKDQKTLRVHFLNTNVVQRTVTGITISGGETIPTVKVLPPMDGPAAWTPNPPDPEGRPILTLKVSAPGDFSFYTLQINSSALDTFFNHVKFSFKANCPSDLDCAPVTPPCPPLSGDLPPIDYLAKDFLSFRRALSDFSALRYPDWRERSEADFGVMFMEALSAVADDLSYQQDRIAAEAALDTASERRSIVQHARLVDYEPRPATCARTWLVCSVGATVTALPAGVGVAAA